MALPSSEPPETAPKPQARASHLSRRSHPCACIPQLLKFFPAPFASLHSILGSIPTIQERKPSLSSLVGLGLWGWEGFAAAKARTGEVQGNAAPGGEIPLFQDKHPPGSSQHGTPSSTPSWGDSSLPTGPSGGGEWAQSSPEPALTPPLTCPGPNTQQSPTRHHFLSPCNTCCQEGRVSLGGRPESTVKASKCRFTTQTRPPARASASMFLVWGEVTWFGFGAVQAFITSESNFKCLPIT